VIWARRLGKAAVIAAYVVTEPVAAFRAVWDVWRGFARDGD
jgi:hypothetical protein